MMRGELRAGRREAAGDRGARSVQRRARLQIGGTGRGKVRTANMRYMFVTRDVSKPSGWLNWPAWCRGSQAGHTVRGELRAGETEERCDCRLWGSIGQWGGAHVEHGGHVRYTGRVPV